VDCNIRQKLLEQAKTVSVAKLAERWQDGREKLLLHEGCSNGGGLIRIC
jgi:hypothetical protein